MDVLPAAGGGLLVCNLVFFFFFGFKADEKMGSARIADRAGVTGFWSVPALHGRCV